MRNLTQEQCNSLLLVWYLTRSGKTKLKDAATNLGIYVEELAKTAKALDVKKVITFDKATKEIELVGNPKVSDVVWQFSLSRQQVNAYNMGKTEHRTLVFLSKLIDEALEPVFSKTMRLVGNDLVISEVNRMDKVSTEVSN